MTEPQTRTYQKASFSIFEDACVKLNSAPQSLSLFLGYRDHSWSAWKADGEIPMPATVAIEAMINLRKRERAERESCAALIAVAVNNATQRAAVLAFCKAMNIEAAEMKFGQKGVV